jgi:hypothetical protein
MQRYNLYLDEKNYRIAKVKKPFTVSQLTRFWLTVLVRNEDELYKLKKDDEEFAAILHYVTPKIRLLLGHK